MDEKTRVSAAQVLARKYQVSPVVVERMFESVGDELAAQARVTSFLSIIVARHVEDQLRAAAMTSQAALPRAA